jgi:hypothetical protein
LTTAPTAHHAIKALLRAVAVSFCQRGKPHGCLIVLGATNCSSANDDIAEFLRERRAERRTLILARLQQGVFDGDLASTVNLRAAAAFYVATIDGLAVAARDGASRKTLYSIVDNAMAAWDNLIAAT